MGKRPKNSNEQYALNQRSPAEGKGKGQKLLAQGIALGIKAMSKAPCKGNSFILPGVLKLLPLQGDRLPPQTTQGVALGYELLPLQGVLGTGVSLKIACRRICMVSNSNEQHALNQRSPAEGKGKGQKLLAQGIALGIKAMSKAPCKGNSFILPGVLKLLPLQGDRLPPQTTQGVALG